MTLGSGSHAESAMAAFARRQVQLDTWRESDTAKESTDIRNRPKRVKFADKCIFQAACASNDKAQILKMLQEGYDINGVDEDGITALHQACIDDNYEMVEFLLAHGADVNISDNEGWTPLHAVASCCYVSIAKLLLEHGANVVALNNDCCIPLDICRHDEIKEMFKQDINGKGINLNEARRREEIKMMEDAKRWISSGAYEEDPHPTTGATGLHVAACKGYIKVLDLLIKAGADVNQQDNDGWTPLHAAAHWGQKEACEVLLESLCDMNIKNNCDQTVLDVADDSVVPILEDYRKKHDVNKNIEAVNASNVLPLPPKKKAPRATFDDGTSPVAITGSSSEEDLSEAVDKVGELRILPTTEPPIVPTAPPAEVAFSPTVPANDINEVVEEVKEDNAIPKTGDTATSRTQTIENEKSSTPDAANVPLQKAAAITTNAPAEEIQLKTAANILEIATADDNTPAWRRGGSLRTRNSASTNDDKPNDNSLPRRTKGESSTGTDVNLRRAYSFESDSKFFSRLTTARNRIKAIEAAMSANVLDHNSLQDTLTSSPALSNNNHNNPPVPTHNSLEVILRRKDSDPPRSPRPTTISGTTPQQLLKSSPTSTPNTVHVRSKSPIENGTSTQGTVPTNGSQKVGAVSKFKQFLIKSFVPPTRDEESETQRKAHAKRVRETRRSTQGVTLEELKSAEQYVKNSQQATTVPTTSSTVPTASSITVPANLPPGLRKEEESLERRPSWRLRVDDTDRNKFSLEDVSRVPGSPSSRRSSKVDSSSLYSSKPPRPPSEESQLMDDDRESKSSGAQGAILRKKKTKRRSTGVVQYSTEDLDTDRFESNHSDTEVGSGRGSDLSNDTNAGAESSRNENGVTNRVNYRKLYEEVLKENVLLKSRLSRCEEEVTDLKNKLEKVTLSNQRFGSDESERREKRALELKMEAMELELREVRHLKSENQKIRDENGALIRVISKLSK